MKTVTYGVCEKCGKELKTDHDGLIFQGNVYAFSLNEDRGGLIGNNFPTPEPDGTIFGTDINEVCYCNDCTVEILFGTRGIHYTQEKL